MELIEIRWKGPLPAATAHDSIMKNIGIYIYVTLNRLKKTKEYVYIGKSEHATDRVRDHEHKMRQHMSQDDIDKSSMYIGTVHPLEGSYESRQLADIENFFIVRLKPRGNGEQTKKAIRNKSLLLINTGAIGSLPRIMSCDDQLLSLLREGFTTKTRKTKTRKTKVREPNTPFGLSWQP